jgi:hypothetical protein
MDESNEEWVASEWKSMQGRVVQMDEGVEMGTMLEFLIQLHHMMDGPPQI